MTFQPNQKVTVTPSRAVAGLPAGEYTVACASSKWVYLKQDNRLSSTGGWLTRRFTASPVKAAAPNKNVPRALNGRFAAVKVERPTVFRISAIYKVKRKSGHSLAKFVASVTTKGNEFVVLAAHGKPFVVKKSNVTFANKQEVEQYLTAAK